MHIHTQFMLIALEQARLADVNNEVPIGAVLVDNKNNIIAKSYNKVLLNNNPLGHAELNVITQGSVIINNYRLTDFRLYVTLEPCLMCFGAIIHARIGKLYYSACSPLNGAFSKHKLAPHDFNIKIFEGLLETDSAKLLKDFFYRKRYI